MSNSIIEINGVKLEVDTRQATRIDKIAIGTRIKVLIKKYSEYKVYHGVVIGFEPFKQFPTIIIAVAKCDYGSANIEIIYYNQKTEDVELVVANEDDKVALDKNDFCARVDIEIAKKQDEIDELKRRKQYFLDKFACYWSEVETESTDETK